MDSDEPLISFDGDTDEDASSKSSIDDGHYIPAMTRVTAGQSAAPDSPDNMQYLTSASWTRMSSEDLDYLHTSNTASGVECGIIASLDDKRNRILGSLHAQCISVQGPEPQESERQPDHEEDDLPKETRKATVTLAGDGNLSQPQVSSTKMEADWALIDLSGWPDLLPNTICFRDSRRDIPVEGAAEQMSNVSGEVTIMRLKLGHNTACFLAWGRPLR